MGCAVGERVRPLGERTQKPSSSVRSSADAGGHPTELHLHDGAYHAAERFAPEAAISLRIWATRLDALRRALA